MRQGSGGGGKDLRDLRSSRQRTPQGEGEVPIILVNRESRSKIQESRNSTARQHGRDILLRHALFAAGARDPHVRDLARQKELTDRSKLHVLPPEFARPRPFDLE